MTHSIWSRRLAIAGAAIAMTACSSTECLLPPCPAPLAVSLQVLAAETDAPVSAIVEVSGAAQGTFQCTGACQVSGSQGKYHLRVTASGFAAVERDVSVESTQHPCGCPTVATASVVVRLDRVP
jgi:hypothetical protein